VLSHGEQRDAAVNFEFYNKSIMCVYAKFKHGDLADADGLLIAI